MTDESDDPGQLPPAGDDRGDRPESQRTETTVDVTDTTNDSEMLDGLHHVLRNRRRRDVLRCLRTAETPMAVADLADELVRRETDASPPAVQDVREEIYLSLYHYHLPKLADADLVSFDSDRKLASLREDAEDLPRNLVRPSEDDHPIADRPSMTHHPRETD